MQTATAGRGRPRKFGRPSRPITVTLPEDVLARLAAIDIDLGSAIVTALDRFRRPRPHVTQPAELASYGSHAVIVVTPVKALKRLPGVELVPIGSGRALISLKPPQSIPQLEIDIRDAIERGGMNGVERETLEAITEILRQARQSHKMTVDARTIIVLESTRRRRR